MKGFKLLQMLHFVKKEEWHSMKKFMEMHYNEGSDHDVLMQYLYTSKNKLSELSDKEALRILLFPKMSVKSFLNLLSRLVQWLEDWFVWRSIQQKKLEKEAILVDVYNRRGAYMLADKVYKKTMNQIEGIDGLTLQKSKLRAQMLHSMYYSDNPRKGKAGKELLESLVDEHLIHAQDKAKLYLIELINWGRIKNFDYEDVKRKIYQFNEIETKSESIKVFSYLERLVKDLDEDAYLSLWSALKGGRVHLDSNFHTIIGLYLWVYGITLRIAGKLNDDKLVEELLQYVLEKGVVFPDGRITVLRFNAIITMICLLSSFEEAQKIVDRWVLKVEDEYKESTRKVSYAYMYAYYGKPELIIPTLRNLDVKHRSNKLRAIVLEVVALYYDRNENREILRVRILNAKRVFRNQFGTKEKIYFKRFLNFLNVIELLMKLDYEDIDVDLKKIEHITLRSLLQKMISERKKPNKVK